MDYSDVKKLLPHRDPFLFIDKVISVSKDGITAERHVSPEEPLEILLSKTALNSITIFTLLTMLKSVKIQPSQDNQALPAA